jgi:hypothetical protein
VPELLNVLGVNQSIASCHVNEPWLASWRGLASYIVPKVDVQVSAIMRSTPNIQATNDPASSGASAGANLIVSSAVVQQTLGRGLAGGAGNGTFNLALPGAVFPDRLNTVDMRLSKILRISRTKSTVGIDLYNMFNANTGTAFNQVFGSVPATGTIAGVDNSAYLRRTSHPQRTIRALQRHGGLVDRRPGPRQRTRHFHGVAILLTSTAVSDSTTGTSNAHGCPTAAAARTAPGFRACDPPPPATPHPAPPR